MGQKLSTCQGGREKGKKTEVGGFNRGKEERPRGSPYIRSGCRIEGGKRRNGASLPNTERKKRVAGDATATSPKIETQERKNKRKRKEGYARTEKRGGQFLEGRWVKLGWGSLIGRQVNAFEGVNAIKDRFSSGNGGNLFNHLGWKERSGRELIHSQKGKRPVTKSLGGDLDSTAKEKTQNRCNLLH